MHRARVRSSSQPRRYSEPCPRPRRPRHETCTTRRRCSSSRRPCNRPKARRPTYASKVARKTTTVPRAKRHPSMQMARQGNQPTRAERWSGSGSLIHADRLRTATPATSSTPAEWATQRHGRRQATTPSGAGATTAARFARRHRSPRGLVCSVRRSAGRVSLSDFASPPRSTNTRGRRTLVYGSTTIT
jgi:hypothetical protein